MGFAENLEAQFTNPMTCPPKARVSHPRLSPRGAL